MVKLLSKLCALYLLFFSATSFAANITSTLDRNPVAIDESFRLMLQADGDVDRNPDLTPLKKDFEILDTATSTNVSIVNGRYSKKLIWNITLLPKSTGVLTVPSISFGRDRSPALRVAVKNSVSRKSGGSKKFFVEVSTDTKQTWVQSQIIYTVKIFRNINIDNLNTNELTTSDPNAIIQQIGDYSTYETLRNGVRHLVTEVRYAIFPQTSGKLTINPVIAQGYARTRSSTFFDQFMQRGNQKRARSRAITMNINPKPAGITANEWLPASDVKLIEEWSADLNQLKVGEPVTRTITLAATGMLAAQIPDINLPDIPNIKQYPDQAQSEDTADPKGVLGKKTFRVALIATGNGQFEMPAISVPWWNTRTGKQAWATLPAHSLIASGGQVAAPLTPTLTPGLTPGLTPSASSSLPGQQTTGPVATNVTAPAYWLWLSAALATGWLLTVIGFIAWPKYRQRNEQVQAHKEYNEKLSSLRKAVIKAANADSAQNKSAQGVKNALLAWARAQWPEHSIYSLSELAGLVDTNLAEQLRVLNDTLYSENKTDWQAQAFITAFNQFKATKTDHSPAESPLEPLYKKAG